MAVRIIAVALAIVAVTAAAGAAYEAIAGMGDAVAYPPAGRLVDIGGYRLHIDCRGEGSPTVVMDAGLGGSSLDWTLVQPELATTTRVCVYDRAGMGWSEPSPLPRTPGTIADELHLLLENAGIDGPYLLVGHSLAGKNVRMFARAYPEDVAGMVLVDARSEQIDAQTSKADVEAFAAALKTQATAYSLARRFGIARLFGAGLVGEPLLSPAIASEMVLLQTQPGSIDETTREGLARSADDEVLASSRLGSMPLVVIAAEGSMTGIPNWTAAQHSLAALSTAGRLVVAQGSNHPVQLEDPGIVIESVREVLAGVRSNP
jgi:pimeloyl-ACP methyl ester carboxylesterase